MAEAISNTSPLLYLYRIGVLEWLPKIFDNIQIPNAVVNELELGRIKGYDVPDIENYRWLKIVDSKYTPSEWLSLDLGGGELAAMSLGLENPNNIILLDDMLARRTAKAAGLNVSGTLKILLDAKIKGLTETIEPLLNRLQQRGMWLSEDIKRRILTLAGEI